MNSARVIGTLWMIVGVVNTQAFMGMEKDKMLDILQPYYFQIGIGGILLSVIMAYLGAVILSSEDKV